jgi:hypothetical protein
VWRVCARITKKDLGKGTGEKGYELVLKWQREGKDFSLPNHLFLCLSLGIWFMFLRGRVLGRRVGWFGKVVGIPQPPVPLFVVGDMVHVFEGTGVGKEGWLVWESSGDLSKRTRDRIMENADEQNNWVAKSGKKELVRVKKQNTQQKDAYLW